MPERGKSEKQSSRNIYVLTQLPLPSIACCLTEGSGSNLWPRQGERRGVWGEVEPRIDVEPGKRRRKVFSLSVEMFVSFLLFFFS